MKTVEKWERNLEKNLEIAEMKEEIAYRFRVESLEVLPEVRFLKKTAVLEEPQKGGLGRIML